MPTRRVADVLLKLISTTVLAKERGIEYKELRNILTENKWIYNKEGKSHLTKEGRMAGGDMRYTP